MPSSVGHPIERVRRTMPSVTRQRSDSPKAIPGNAVHQPSAASGNGILPLRVLPTPAYAPGVHVHYAETVLPSHDGKPKFKDVPAEMGGSGDNLPE